MPLQHVHPGIARTGTDGLVMCDGRGLVTFVSPAAADLLGLAAAECLGRHWSELPPGLVEVGAAGSPVPVETPNGPALAVHALPGDAGWLLHLPASRPDPAYSEGLVEGLLTAATSPAFAKDALLRYTHVNLAMAELFGLTPDDFIGRTDAEVFGPQAGQHSRAADEAALAGETVRQELRTTVGDVERTYSTVRRPILGADKEVLGLCAVTRETTELRRTLRALERSDVHQRTLSEHVAVGVAHLAAPATGVATPGEMVFTEVNSRWEQITGTRRADLLGLSLAGAAAAMAPGWMAALADAVVPRGEGRAEYHDAAADRWYSVLGLRPFAEEAVLLLEDVTDRRRADMGLRSDHQVAWTLLNATGDMALLVSSDGTIAGANAAAAAGLGRTPEQLVGADVLTLCSAHGAALRATMDRAGALGRPQELDCEREGRRVHCAVVPVPSAEPGGQAFALFFRDVAEQEQDPSARGTAVLGRLSAAVAHEFNNILVGMMLRAERAQELDSVEEFRKLADVVLGSGQRGAEMCRNLQTFADPRPPRLCTVTIEEILEGALALCMPRLDRAGIEVERNMAQGGIQAPADPGQLEQVFVNLLVNACNAMPGGGTLTVSTRRDRRPDGTTTAVCSIADTGVGIAPEALGRVFDPLHAVTEGRGKSGTGLGLPVAKSLVEAHGGELSVVSTPGAGSTFSVALVACSDAAPATGYAQAEEEQGATRCSVLVVEDEPELRTLLCEVLQEAGHAPRGAGAVDEAIALLAEQAWDVVITDLLLPGGNGRDVVKAAVDRGGPPAIVMTGKLGEEERLELVSAGAAAFLRKPFSFHDLLRAIDGALDSR